MRDDYESTLKYRASELNAIAARSGLRQIILPLKPELGPGWRQRRFEADGSNAYLGGHYYADLNVLSPIAGKPEERFFTNEYDGVVAHFKLTLHMPANVPDKVEVYGASLAQLRWNLALTFAMDDELDEVGFILAEDWAKRAFRTKAAQQKHERLRRAVMKAENKVASTFSTVNTLRRKEKAARRRGRATQSITKSLAARKAKLREYEVAERKAHNALIIYELKTLRSELGMDLDFVRARTNPGHTRDNPSFARVRRIMMGQVPSIRTVGIFTAQNPRATKLPPKWNKALNKKLMAWLRERGYGPIPIGGMYGMEEDSYLVPNITRKDTIEVGLMFNQESVIWASRVGTGRQKRMVWQFIEGTRTIITRDVSLSGKDIQSRKDYYSIVKGRKFLIPFFDEKYSVSARRKAAAAKKRRASNRTLLASPRSGARGNPPPRRKLWSEGNWTIYLLTEHGSGRLDERASFMIVGEGSRTSHTDYPVVYDGVTHRDRYSSDYGVGAVGYDRPEAIPQKVHRAFLRIVQDASSPKRRTRRNPTGYTGSAEARKGKVMYRPVVVMADGSKRRPRMYLPEDSEGIRASKAQRTALSRARGTISLVGEAKKPAAKKATTKKPAAKKATTKKATTKKATTKKATTRALWEVARAMNVDTVDLIAAMEAKKLRIGRTRLKAMSRVTAAMEKKIASLPVKKSRKKSTSARKKTTTKKKTTSTSRSSRSTAAKKSTPKKSTSKKPAAKKSAFAKSGSAALKAIREANVAPRRRKKPTVGKDADPTRDIFPDDGMFNKDVFLVAAEVVEERPRKGPPPFRKKK